MLFARRSRFRKLEKYLERKVFRSFPLSANTCTLLAVVSSLTFLFLCYLKRFSAAVFFLFFSFLLDIVDGMVARAKREASDAGAYIDTVADRVVEIAVFAGLYFAGLDKLLLLLSLSSSLMVTYVKAAAYEKLKVSVKGGLMERAERCAFLVIIFITRSNMLLLLFFILSSSSALYRFVRALSSRKR
jgi:archaetidylinositol phosphate synthase